MTGPDHARYVYFTTPEGREYAVSKALIEDGGMSAVAAMVQQDRDGITDDGQMDWELVTEADAPMSLDVPDCPPNRP